MRSGKSVFFIVVSAFVVLTAIMSVAGGAWKSALSKPLPPTATPFSGGTPSLKATSTPTRTPTSAPPPTATDTSAPPTPTDTSAPPTDTDTPSPTDTPADTDTPGPTPTDTDTPTETEAPLDTPTPTDTIPPAETPTATDTRSPTNTPTSIPTLARTATPTPIPTVPPTPGAGIAPFPSAPLCPDVGAAHNVSEFHSLWDSTRGCHYDHEHGASPFTPEVAAALAPLDLDALLCFVHVGHCNPSSPIENTVDGKHGGMKWQVDDGGCVLGFESAEHGLGKFVIQWHDFGDSNHEFDARFHSGFIAAVQCDPGDPRTGRIAGTIHFDFGQRLYDYQNGIMPYPNNPIPSYPAGLGPYLNGQSILGGINKQDTRAAILAANGNVAGTWTSKGGQTGAERLFNILFRVRDSYEATVRTDTTYPFTFSWMCSNDGGLNYAIKPCRYNNSTSRVHEVQIIVPAYLDGLLGFDTNPEVGRITGEGYFNRAGDLAPWCTGPTPDCFLWTFIDVKPGHTGTTTQPDKTQQFTPIGLPERDIYFCGQVVCTETSPGAVPSGWIGPGN